MKVVDEFAFSGNQYLVRIYFGEGIEEIRVKACFNCRKITSVSLPSTLRNLYSAFEGCSGITSITYPEGLEYLGSGWIYLMTGLQGVIHIPASVTTVLQTTVSSAYITGFNVSAGNANYKSQDGCILSKDGSVLYLVPSSSSWLSEYTTPSTVTYIANEAFGHNYSLRTLTLSEGVVEAYSAIGSLSNLTTLNLPSTLTTSPFTSYPNLNNLAAINVASNSNTFTSVDGVLFSKDLTELVKYPGGKQAAYEVPSTTKVIKAGGLTLAILRSLTLNEGLTHLESWAMRQIQLASSSLGTLRIPNSLTQVTDTSFFTCNFDEFQVDASHTTLSTDGPILYNKNRTVALVYACNPNAARDRVVTLPSTVRSIYYGFSYANFPVKTIDLSQTSVTRLPTYFWNNLTNDGVERNVVLPNTLTTIDSQSVMVGTMKTLTIPASVTTIAAGAIGLPEASEIIFLNRGTFIANSIFNQISPRCVIRGYRGSSAESVALQYTLRFEPLD